MKAKPHQIDIAEQAIAVLREYGLVYISAEERVGKTISAILVSEWAKNINSILVITKKEPIKGWHETLTQFEHQKVYRVTNYHQVHKLQGDYDLIIIDEAHSYIAGYPKRSTLWNAVKKKTILKPIIYLSATPHAQGYQMMFNQFALSSWSPWAKYQNFYSWFADYKVGEPKLVKGRKVNDYTSVDDERIEKEIKHLFISKTRKEAGFEHEPEDVLHFIELKESTKLAYNYMLKKKLIELKDKTLLLDTPMKLRTSLHMLEGGIAKNTIYTDDFEHTGVIFSRREKIEDAYIYHVYYELDNTEKIDYIREHWGDSPKVAIMYAYTGELYKLKRYFKNISFFQATSHAEGTDLSMFEHLIIYSQTFSTAKHTQRRARQANMKRTEAIKVHFLLVKKAISEQVYETVSINKVNYVDTRFIRETL